ncbi:MAG TPA: alkaline phosphatase family protein [Acidimicrobiales bacterium]|nr:alkaline phosphatase family protein [Acidimicrobiales bacterium]
MLSSPKAPAPVLPDYGGACIDAVVPSLLRGLRPSWLPAEAAGARQVVLLALDGLGWEQLQERRAAGLAPQLASMAGGPITTVAPSTTATALTSLVTGTPPAQHGVLGYRVATAHGVLNVLRWRTPEGDARQTVPPAEFQRLPPFEGRPVPVVTRAEFARTGFTTAQFTGARLVGWRALSTLVVEVRALLEAGEPFVYAYYDGVDKVAHEYGFGAHYDAELAATDRLVADLCSVLPPGAVLVVTADHGQVQVGSALVTLDPDVLADVELLSGEARFRWLHLRPGVRADDVAALARSFYGELAWVHTRDEVIEAGWFGGPVPPDLVDRIGDVAVVPFQPVALLDPADTGETTLVCRHGSLTSAEMLVPLLVHRA